MRNAFIRSEEFLNLELQKNNLTKIASSVETAGSQPTQMALAIDQAESLISQGWRFVGTLPKDRAVVEKIGPGL